MPLQHEVGGPDSLDDVRFVVGGRITSGGRVDKLLLGEYVSTSVLTGVVPLTLGECVTSCAEDLQATLMRAGITVGEFDVTQRSLRLYGDSSAANYLDVLRTLQYTNRATSHNLNQFSFYVSDGINSANYSLPVTIVSPGKRKRSVASHPAAPKPILPFANKEHDPSRDSDVRSPPLVDNFERTSQRKRRSTTAEIAKDSNQETKAGMWSLPMMVVSAATVVLALVVAWVALKKTRKEDTSQA